MGVYAEYLDKGLSGVELWVERKKQLKRISDIRGRDLLVLAADLRKQAPIAISFEDLLPFQDQLSNLSGTAIDVIIETPGGDGQIAESIVRTLRQRYNDIAFIVPGTAMSAGTIMVMSGDEILMDQHSSLGPIDAQLQFQGKQFSAEAFLKGLEKIKIESGSGLNRAYVPILQNISPGDIQHAENALEFARDLVTRWLAEYKFRTWTVHSSNGQQVTDEERRSRAREVAQQLCDHSKWLSHGRRIRLADLEKMRLRISDFSQMAALADAIRRYYTLLQMTFDVAHEGIYKIYETTTSQIFRRMMSAQQPGTPPAGEAQAALLEIACPKCHTVHKVQVNLSPNVPIQPGALAYPANDVLKCVKCKTDIPLVVHRKQIEQQANRKVVLQ